VESTYICVESLVQIKPKLKKVFLTSDPQWPWPWPNLTSLKWPPQGQSLHTLTNFGENRSKDMGDMRIWPLTPMTLTFDPNNLDLCQNEPRPLPKRTQTFAKTNPDLCRNKPLDDIDNYGISLHMGTKFGGNRSKDLGDMWIWPLTQWPWPLPKQTPQW
jgi:hypothetical protein